MNKIDEKLQQIRKDKKMGLMTHVVVGYPSLTATEKLVLLMDKIGVDFIELQIPFSDPLADGPTIMKASEKALRDEIKVKDCFDLAKKLTKQVKIPLLFMAYFNTVFKYGVERFCKGSKTAGISALIVPDIPLEEEECENFMKFCNKYGLNHIRVISPASNDKRLDLNSKVANGFVYATARQGITGARSSLDPKLINFLVRVRKYFKVPVAVGFGISKKEHVQALKGHADIVIIGSALIDVINNGGQNYLKDVELFLKELL